MKRISAAELQSNVLKLPRLPIPPLTATIDGYRSSLRALWSNEVSAPHLEKLDAFASTSAPVLQKFLMETDKVAAEAGTRPYTYLEAMMAKSALSSRFPLEVNMNAGFVLAEQLPGTDHTQAGVASAMTHAIATWIHEVKTQGLEVPQDAAAQFDVSPLLTEFGRSLIPSKEEDAIHTTPLEKLRHIIVLHDGHPYAVRVFDDNQSVLDRKLIQKAFEFILSITPDEDNPAPVAVLTAGSRAVWGQAYQELLKTPENAEAMRLFHESILVVCLDGQKWGTNESLAEASALHGSEMELENRWYDKHQMIVSEDGQVAFNFEATASDRVHWAKWIGDVLNILKERGGSGAISTEGIDGAAVSGVVQHVSVTYGKSFVTHIRAARQEALAIVKDTEVHSIHIPYGRAQLTQLRVEPDAFVQMCLQLAMYQLRNKLCSTTEVCSTARFFHGTTELMHTATEEMLQLATTLAQQQQDSATAAAATPDSNNKETLAKLIRAMSSRHVSLTAAAARGEGFDRHLMALRQIAQINGDKAALAFFEDDLFTKTNSAVLATSEFSKPWLRYYTFGPVFHNGYGLGYVIDEQEVRVSLSAFTNSPATNVSDLKSALAVSCDTLYSLLGGVPAAKPAA